MPLRIPWSPTVIVHGDGHDHVLNLGSAVPSHPSHVNRLLFGKSVSQHVTFSEFHASAYAAILSFLLIVFFLVHLLPSQLPVQTPANSSLKLQVQCSLLCEGSPGFLLYTQTTEHLHCNKILFDYFYTLNSSLFFFLILL